MADDTARAWAYLSRVAEPPCAELAALVARVGAVEAADRIRRGAVGGDLARLTEARREIDCAAEDLDILARLGGRLMVADDAEWPMTSFRSFRGVDVRARPQGHSPLALWTVGPLALTDVEERGCSIVGTRAATPYGEHVAADLAAGLGERDVAVVSGGAYGIDGAAHRATLAADGLTVAVLAGGIDVPYPAGHTALLRRIADDGLIVSEYPPGVRPARYRFLTRNRLVAALSGATVVVEAGLRSGAANTAAWARALGRPVCAVPGPVTSSASVGCHVLVRGGAELITRAEEVVELVGRAGELAPEPDRPSTPLDGLADVERRVFDALPARGASTADQVAVATGLPATRVLGPLATLELAGLVKRQGGRWKLAVR
jgi:DNA processing protein